MAFGITITYMNMNIYIDKHKNRLSFWITCVCTAVLMMIIIGGYTRLTGSGLSITEWKPIVGIMPPITDVDWLYEFNKYKESPEFNSFNYNMELVDFKKIFWPEFIHRNAGRITVLLFFIPFVYFIFTGAIKSHILSYVFAAFLMLMQGVVGWYMVQSGLAKNPHVSHFRLALHLIIAVSIYAIFFWHKLSFIDWTIKLRDIFNKNFASPMANKFKLLACSSIILCFLQISLGAMVAGLKAGLVYNSFPLMGGEIIPSEIYENFSFNIELFSNPVFVQLLHRMIAYILCLNSLVIIFYLLKLRSQDFVLLSLILLIGIFLQIALGIITLIYIVPIVPALFHQIGSIMLLSILLLILFITR